MSSSTVAIPDPPPATVADRAPKRVLHIVAQMRPGGIETWLLQVARKIDRSRFQLDFMVHVEEPQAYDDELRALGCQILPCPRPHQVFGYLRRMDRLLRKAGPYDVVHSHLHHFSGLHMWVARRAGVPIRIAHCHSNTAEQDARAPLHRRLYHSLMRRMLKRHCTQALAASPEAATALFGPRWAADPRYQVVYCGIDTQAFEQVPAQADVRRSLGLAQDAIVVGHVGRISPPKNHPFFLQVAKILKTRDSRFRFLVVGDGPLRAEVEQTVAAAGLQDAYCFTGARDDIPSLHAAMDLFLFPSAWEGLPLAFVEAQASGLPCVFSDVVTTAAEVAPGLTHRLPLAAGPERWADKILEVLQLARPNRMQALAAVKDSPLNLERGVRGLERIYHGDS